MPDFEKIKASFTPNYNPAPFIIERAEGCLVIDQEGHEYLDFSSGIAVNNLGHTHPRIRQAVESQLNKIWHSSNLFWNQPAIHLAERLCELSFADRVFFCNSGTEANEAALKLARKHFFDQQQPRPNYVAFEGGFHGRSMGALSVTSKESFRKPFEPLVAQTRFGKWNEMKSLELIDESVAAVIFEPIQGEAGVYPIDLEFAKALRRRCDETQTLLIADCIQVGMMRAGSLFGIEELGITPDLMTLAKGLGNGFPIGALLCRSPFGEVLQVGSHGTTFGGNPLACAAALAVVDVLTDPQELAVIQKNAEYFSSEIRKRFGNHPKVKDIRGRFMMIGLEINGDLASVFQGLRDEKVLVTQIKPHSLRILPPLVASPQESDRFFEALQRVLDR